MSASWNWDHLTPSQWWHLLHGRHRYVITSEAWRHWPALEQCSVCGVGRIVST